MGTYMQGKAGSGAVGAEMPTRAADVLGKWVGLWRGRACTAKPTRGSSGEALGAGLAALAFLKTGELLEAAVKPLHLPAHRLDDHFAAQVVAKWLATTDAMLPSGATSLKRCTAKGNLLQPHFYAPAPAVSGQFERVGGVVGTSPEPELFLINLASVTRETPVTRTVWRCESSFVCKHIPDSYRTALATAAGTNCVWCQQAVHW